MKVIQSALQALIYAIDIVIIPHYPPTKMRFAFFSGLKQNQESQLI